MAKKNKDRIITIEFNGDKWEIVYHKMSEMRGICVVVNLLRNEPKWYQSRSAYRDYTYQLLNFDEYELYKTAATMIAKYYTNKEEDEKVDKFFNEFFKED